MLLCKQAGATDASVFQLTTHPNVKSTRCCELQKNPAAKALLSRLELSPTALYFAKEQRRLSIQAQEEDEDVKQTEAQAPK